MMIPPSRLLSSPFFASIVASRAPSTATAVRASAGATCTASHGRLAATPAARSLGMSDPHIVAAPAAQRTIPAHLPSFPFERRGVLGLRSERAWLRIGDSWFDKTFLTSSFECLYGKGCKGILHDREPPLIQGCCTHVPGAFFESAEDLRRITRIARELTDDEWQQRRYAQKLGHGLRLNFFKQVSGVGGSTLWSTRAVGEECIFLNRPHFPGGGGCALHLHALRTRRHPTETKPKVCWMAPLQPIEIPQEDGSMATIVTEWGRDGWGPAGEYIDWWCTEDPAAFRGSQPVYRSMARELRLLVGDRRYRQLVAAIER
jgi:hypothetical protein